MNETHPASESGSASQPAPQGALRSGWQRFLLGRRPLVTFIRALVLAVACFVVFKFFLIPIRVTGNSMSPTYRNGGINLVNRMAYRHHPPQRGDVVAIRTSGESVLIMKRIIGLPGELLSVRRNRVLINGRELDEPYLVERADWARGSRRLGPDEYFVAGDNREISDFGPVSPDRIVGKVLF